MSHILHWHKNTWKYIWPLCRKSQSSYSLNCLFYFYFLVCYETFTLLPSIVDISLCPSKNTVFAPHRLWWDLFTLERSGREMPLLIYVCICWCWLNYWTIFKAGYSYLGLPEPAFAHNLCVQQYSNTLKRNYSMFSTEINPHTHQEGQVKRRNICKSHKFHHNTLK